MTTRREWILFWSLALTYCTVWCVLPAMLMPNPRLDVPEMSFVGKEWVIGYFKHPTLPTWLLRIFELLTGRSAIAPYLASQFCILVCLWGIWRIARRFTSAPTALIGTFAMTGYLYFGYESTQYNHQTPLMALVVLTAYFTCRAFEENRIRWWVAAGMAIGCALLTKYQAVLLPFSIVLFLIVNRQARRFLRSPGPYLTTAVAFFIFLPHLIWVYTTDFAILGYVEGYSNATAAETGVSILAFLGAQLGCLAPLMLSFLPLTSFRWRPRLENERRRFFFQFFATIVLTPVVLHLIAAGFGMKLKPYFTAFLWTLFTPLYLFGVPAEIPPDGDGANGDHGRFLSGGFRNRFRMICAGRITAWSFRCAAVFIVAMALVMVAILVGEMLLTPYIMKNKGGRFLFPGHELATIAERYWDEYYGPDHPCRYVTGEWWLAGNAAMRMRSDPHVFAGIAHDSMDEPRPLSSWCTPEDVRRGGGLVFWQTDSDQYVGGVPESLYRDYPEAVRLPDVALPYHRIDRVARIGIALVPIPGVPPRTAIPADGPPGTSPNPAKPVQ